MVVSVLYRLKDLGAGGRLPPTHLWSSYGAQQPAAEAGSASVC